MTEKDLLPHDEYFKFGNFYSGSRTKNRNIFNYYVNYSDEKYICKTWKGLVCSEKAENIIEKIFESHSEVLAYLSNEIKGV